VPRPYTLSFGSWSPDLQNVGVQLGAQYTDTPVPCSDVLNVYYADGAFRSIPSPASIGPSLGVPITNAVNWYDDSTGKEQIFAATANGLYVLVDGTWSALPVQTNSQYNATGQAITITLGAPVYLSISGSVSPSSASSTGTATTQTTGTVMATPTGTGSSFTYSWSLLGGSSPNLSVVSPSSATTAFKGSGMSGGNIYTGTAQCVMTDNDGLVSTVGGVSVSVTCTAPTTYTGTLTAGQYNSGYLYYLGLDPTYSIGSISPSTDLHGNTIAQLYFFEDFSTSSTYLQLKITGASPQTYFNTLYVNGTPFTAASATYSSGTWTWNSVADPMGGVGSYAVGITY
jgi:hypothetical protein